MTTPAQHIHSRTQPHTYTYKRVHNSSYSATRTVHSKTFLQAIQVVGFNLQKRTPDKWCAPARNKTESPGRENGCPTVVPSSLLPFSTASSSRPFRTRISSQFSESPLLPKITGQFPQPPDKRRPLLSDTWMLDEFRDWTDWNFNSTKTPRD